MLPIERLERIKEYIATNEFADINDLAQILEVSTATVRRSLKQLENDRVVNLTRGGATLAKKGAVYEHPYMVKRHLNAEEKRRIAQEASRRVGKNQSLFLDSSSTVFEMTTFISGGSPMVVATNDVLIAAELTNSDNLSVSVIGGTLRKGYYTLTGYFAEMAFRDVSFDFAFLGIDTISLRGGLMITNSEEVQIKRKVADASKRVVVLCDHSKFEQESFLHVCAFDRVDEVITGRELDDEVYRKYLENDVNLTRV